jgi:hypothetical protein
MPGGEEISGELVENARQCQIWRWTGPISRMPIWLVKIGPGGRKMAWGIHTIYIPRENLRFLEEWIQYHLLLGAEYFYLYDNTGSTFLDLGNSIAITGKNKYGVPIDFSLTDAEVEEIEAEIFRKYPVQKIKWQPRQDGKIVLDQPAACDHFAETYSADWCAFIDTDEFLCSPFKIDELLEGSAVRICQKKFEDRHHYRTALEITKSFSINTQRWAPKLIIRMKDYVVGAKSKNYVVGDKSIHNLPTRTPPIPLALDVLRFNHYNHNRRGHQWLLENYQQLDPSWQPKAFEVVFDENCGILSGVAKKIDYAKFTKVTAAAGENAAVTAAPARRR